MRKKVKQSRISDDELNSLKGGLPDPSEVNEMISSVSESKAGRPKKKKSVGRVQLTTSMHRSLVDQLKIEAVKRGCTVADLLEGFVKSGLDKLSQ